jgi:peptidoglycan/xylan/chitin deacetylase (PgdA/CDA1 family)
MGVSFLAQNDLNSLPFTLDDYRYLIRLARNHYQFVFYDRAGETNNPEPIVFWYHDIDFSPSRAVQLAEIEAEEGVQSTFFVHLHSAFYHFWEPYTIEQIRRLIKLGHQIGLHFDSHFYGDYLGNNLPKKIKEESVLLQDLIAQPVRVFSFHNTTPHILEVYLDDHRWID